MVAKRIENAGDVFGAELEIKREGGLSVIFDNGSEPFHDSLGFFLPAGDFLLGFGGWGHEIKERTGRFGSFFTFHGSGRDGSKAGRLDSFV